jgi:hypothetical protein
MLALEIAGSWLLVLVLVLCVARSGAQHDAQSERDARDRRV